MYINMNEILDKFSQFTSSYKISFNTEIVNFKFSTKNLQNYSPYCLYIFRANKLPKEIFNYNKINFLIIGEPQDLPYLDRCNYIILKEDSISIFDIIKIIQKHLVKIPRCFNFYIIFKCFMAYSIPSSSISLVTKVAFSNN